MPEPEFDADGYPTDATLEALKEWPHTDLDGGLAFLRKAWKYPDYFTEEKPGVWHVSTGGWSGNEDLISAMHRNFILWSQWFWSMRRGGHYVFSRKNPDA